MQSQRRQSQRRRSMTALSAILVLALAGSGTTAAVGGSSSAGSSSTLTAEADSARPAPEYELAGLSRPTYRITLFTGDTVTLTRATGGGYAVTVDIEPRAHGSSPTYRVSNEGSQDGLYVIPQDVQPSLAAGQLDMELFNVAYLAANGYADDDQARLPVIVEYADQPARAMLTQRAASLDDSRPTVTLESIDAAAVTVDKSEAGRFWQDIDAARRIEKVWLDRVVNATLDQSVPQIGAPEAYTAGYDGTGVTVAVLDTGIDLGHPDLADKVVATESFIDGENLQDGRGHGTHVASIVAGSGAASGGQYTGVAPGAELVVGKVLSNEGTGTLSTVMAGMEWAAVAHDADIVNLSLGSVPTDGTDPLSQSVNVLTEQTGALFVIAAGNAGPFAGTVTTPATADSALAVGSVDKSDQLANTSSRGPRVGDLAIKPEITAPGVGLVAARAAGTNLGPPVGDSYTRLSGTSMATPHVAGAAAVLAQQHPDWGPEQLKAALVTTAADGGYTVHQQGAGRLDVGRAVRQQVTVSPALADFRMIRWDQPDDPVTKTLTFTNPADQPVTLDVEPSVRTTSGVPVPDGVVTTTAASVVVAAGGSAAIDVTLDHAALQPGQYTGHVRATSAGGTQLTVPVGFVISEETHQVTVTVNARDGSKGFPAGGGVVFLKVGGDPAVLGDDDFSRSLQRTSTDTAAVAAALTPGTWFVAARVGWLDDANIDQQAFLFASEVEITGSTEIILDAADAQKIRLDVPDETERFEALMTYTRESPDGSRRWTTTIGAGPMGGHFWVTPTAPVSTGTFVFGGKWVLGEPLVHMALTGSGGVSLHPTYHDYRPWYATKLPAGHRTLQLVYAGRGSAEDFARVDARGRLVLLERVERPDGAGCEFPNAQLERAGEAGAVGVIFDPGPCSSPIWPTVGGGAPAVPHVAVPPAEAQLLIDRLSDGPVRVRVNSDPEPDYTYQLAVAEAESIPSSLRYRFSHAQLASVTARYHADPPLARMARAWFTLGPEHNFTTDTPLDLAAPTVRREYYGPVDDVVHERHVFFDDGSSRDTVVRTDIFDGRTDRVDRWSSRPVAPGGVPTHPAVEALEPGRLTAICPACSQGDLFYPVMHITTPDPGQRLAGEVLLAAGAPGVVARLYRDGVEVSPSPDTFRGVLGYQLATEPSRYRLEVVARGTHTGWEFTSAPVTQDETPVGTVCVDTVFTGSTAPCRAEPLIFLRYDADVDLRNGVPVPGSHQLRVSAYHVTEGSPIAGLKLWASGDDDGTRWQRLHVHERRDGEFVATVPWPVLRGGSNVSIKAEAWDNAGNRVEQTVHDAYHLNPR